MERVPHKVRVSYDVAHCVCGEYQTSDDSYELDAWKITHETDHLGEVVYVYEVGEYLEWVEKNFRP